MAIFLLFTMNIGRTKKSRYKFVILTFILHIHIYYQNYNHSRSKNLHVLITVPNMLRFLCLYMFALADSNLKRAITLHA